jgi:hypothetical protein
MAVISAAEFRQNILDICSNSQAVMRIQIISETRRQVRIRIFLANRAFLDVYYSSETKKTAFAQIKNNERVFGADNSGTAWHWHPYEDPQRRDFTNTEITFFEFLNYVEENIKK